MTLTGGTGSGVVLDLIRSGRATTRSELLDVLGWSRVTLGKRLDELLSDELLVRAGTSASGGGRPREEFAVNPAAGLILAVDIGNSHSRVAITDAVGGVLVEDEADIGLFEGPDEVFDWARQVFVYLLHQLGRRLEDVRAVGVGVPGPVDWRTGRLGSPQLDPRWDGLRVADHLSAFGDDVLVAVDRDVNILALAEARLAWPEHDDLIVVKTGIGVGCAFVLDRNVYRGSLGGAGQLSAPMRARLTEPLQRLEVVASGGVVRDGLARSGRRLRTSAEIVALVQHGDAEAIALIEEVGEVIGYTLADAVGLLNPSVVVLGGNLSEAGDVLVGAVRRALFAAAHPFSRQNLVVERNRLREKAGVRGASLLAQDALFEPGRVSVRTYSGKR